MAERYVVITTSKFRKGVQVSVHATGTREQMEAWRSERKWAHRRPQPHIIKESEVAAFTKKHQTGIFAPTYKPPTAEEIRTAAERKKAQEKFEREREAAKLATPKGEIARQLLTSKYGILSQRPLKEIMTAAAFEKLRAAETERRKQETFRKQEILQRALKTIDLQARTYMRGITQTTTPIIKETDFFPVRKPSIQETIILAEQKIAWPSIFGTGAEIRAGGLKDIGFKLAPITDIDLERLQQTAEIGKTAKLQRQLMAGGAAALGTEFILGTRKAKGAIPEAAGFGALAFVSPFAAGAVGVTATAMSIPALQKEFLEKGFARTVAHEAPTLFLFAGAGGIGARLRTTARVRETAFDIKLDRLTAKDIDPTFTFQKKPYAIIGKGKPPPFLQRTLKGDVLIPEKLEFFQRRITAPELKEPTTIKELRQYLAATEKRLPITKAEAKAADIFRPEIEEFYFAEPARKGLVTPRKLGIKERQLQLRATYPTVAQKYAYVLQQMPRAYIPTRQTELPRIFTGKKAQAGLMQFRPQDILRGAGEGLRRFKPKTELPKIIEPEILAGRRAGAFIFPPVFITDTAAGQIDFPISRTAQLQGVLTIPSLDQISIPDQKPVIDLGILQISTQKFRSAEDFLFKEVTKQKTREILDVPIVPIFDDPIIRVPSEEPPPEKIKKITAFRGLTFDEMIQPPSKEGYDIIIREKGQDVEYNKKRSYPRQRAKNKGADIVDNSAAASFRIRKSKQPIDSGIDDSFFFLGHKFRSPARKSKLPPKQFIEKRGFRIDSAGELAGITAKGLIAKRKKEMFGGWL